ncbi:MAG: hypothetical protein JWO54_496 [Candidatus Saccharibacteria bacterium]|nr:hypothetical protein [Candidatus Saccharibacteria bacterium]
MSRHEIRLLSVRMALLGGSIVGLLVSTATLVKFEMMMSVLPYILTLLGAVVVLLGVYRFTWLALKKAYRQQDGWSVPLPSGLMAFAMILLSFFATASVLGWAIAGGIRDMAIFTSLPEGNLLVAGGFSGWMYMILVIALVVGVLFKQVSAKVASLKKFRLSSLKRTGPRIMSSRHKVDATPEPASFMPPFDDEELARQRFTLDAFTPAP